MFFEFMRRLQNFENFESYFYPPRAKAQLNPRAFFSRKAAKERKARKEISIFLLCALCAPSRLCVKCFYGPSFDGRAPLNPGGASGIFNRGSDRSSRYINWL